VYLKNYKEVYVIILNFIQASNKINNKEDISIIITYGPFLTIIRYILISGSVIIFLWAFFFKREETCIGIWGCLHQISTGGAYANTFYKKKQH